MIRTDRRLPGRTFAFVTVIAFLTVALASCSDGNPPEAPLFVRLSPEQTGVDFANILPETADFNIIDYLYYYNGGGVAAGDVNGDGLIDLYFTSNLEKNRLYLNRGVFVFEDVTDAAGVGGTADWTTGVTMADVNADGLLDIYVSALSGYLNRHGVNELFVNNGDGTFAERAGEFGLAHAGYATQATFFDYDNDGDLDAYILDHSMHTESSIGTTELRYTRDRLAGDRLLRNDGSRFTDVSDKAGIFGSAVGFGLSVSLSDFNLDGCIDIYVANDFHENDYLYHNNCDGTFTESVVASVGHTSRFSRGSDAADFNNDGRPDLVVLDLLPADEETLKTSGGVERFDLYELKRNIGYHHQFARNTLQLNRGLGRFSDIGYLAGVYATDWSWSALFADLDNDGFQDLLVTNGVYRRPNDLDYMAFASEKAAAAAQGVSERTSDAELMAKMPRVPLSNYAFRNSGDLTFENKAAEWGLADPGFSNGAAYADLDDDGDLDIVINNVNDQAWVYENKTTDILPRHNFIEVEATGDGANRYGIGARVYLVAAGRRQYRELIPGRGWLSSSQPRIHFGIGNSTVVDSLVVIWPDRRYEILTAVPANRVLEVRQSDAAGSFSFPAQEPSSPLFRQIEPPAGVRFVHEENTFMDFNREPLMPHKVSMEGPALAIADVNKDGIGDIFAGGAKRQAGQLMVSNGESYVLGSQGVFAADSLNEDVDADFFDADGDGDLDLYVVSGGNEYWGRSEALRDRLYLNDGVGNFTKAADALPDLFQNGCCVAPADFDMDGDVDLFVGSRVVSREYGVAPESYLLENDGTGRFLDVTPDLAPGLARFGMITDAVWTDFNRDGALDLVVTAEWQPIGIFAQEDGAFVNRTTEAGLAGTNGWWNAVTVSDIDSDGFDDLFLGNLGLNSQLKATEAEPVRLYVKDFDGNGSLDQFLTRYVNGVSYPLASIQDMVGAIEPLQKKYTTFTDFGAKSLEDIFGSSALRDAEILEAFTFASAFAKNSGGRFNLIDLPIEAQFAPVYAFDVSDFNNDGRLDAVLAGNFSGVRPDLGRYDASYGLLILGDGYGEFQSANPASSGLLVDGDVREIRRLTSQSSKRLLVFARNGLALRFVETLHESSRVGRRGATNASL